MENNYSQYTSQGASLQEAHTAHTTWAKSNHQSFFNMNNAMGLFKILIVVAIIIIVVIILSPLFKFLKSVLGGASTITGLFNDLLKSCFAYGTCRGATTGAPGGAPGKCDPDADGVSTDKACTIGGKQDQCGSKYKWASVCSAIAIAWFLGMGGLIALAGVLGKLMKGTCIVATGFGKVPGMKTLNEKMCHMFDADKAQGEEDPSKDIREKMIEDATRTIDDNEAADDYIEKRKKGWEDYKIKNNPNSKEYKETLKKLKKEGLVDKDGNTIDVTDENKAKIIKDSDAFGKFKVNYKLKSIINKGAKPILAEQIAKLQIEMQNMEGDKLAEAKAKMKTLTDTFTANETVESDFDSQLDDDATSDFAEGE